MKNFNIYYADDDVEDLEIFHDAIKYVSKQIKSKITIHLHSKGEDLIENISKNKVENPLVFLDLYMLPKTGLQLLTDIRNFSNLKSLPVIMFSTFDKAEDVTLSYKLGANVYATKPNTFQDMIQIISNLVTINWEEHQITSNGFVFKL